MFRQCFVHDGLFAVVYQKDLSFFKGIEAAVRRFGLTWFRNVFRRFPLTAGGKQVADADLIFACFDGLRLPFVPHERHDFP